MSKSKDIMKITATMNRNKKVVSQITKGPDKDVAKDDVIDFCNTIIYHLQDFKESINEMYKD